MKKLRRNDPCPCGSGKKFKKCCLQKNNELTLQEKATSLMNKGSFAEAEELLTEVLHEFDDAIVRNNLATTVLEQGDPERCLDILEPCLDPDRDDMLPNPFTYALASRALTLLGERDDAYLCLEQAEVLFADGLKASQDNNVAEYELQIWKEYTVAIMRAAAVLDDYSRVLDLYYRWEKEHVVWETIYLAGVAAFNLRLYRDAAAFWKEAGKEWTMTLLFAQVALLVEQGVIPHFNLNYRLKDWEEIEKVLKKVKEEPVYLTQAMQDTSFLLSMLAIIFDPKIEEKMSCELMEKMVCQGETWGEELGKRILQANNVSTPIKMAAAQGLVEKGVFAPDELINMVLDGEEKEIRLEKITVAANANRETAAAMHKASRLKEEGRLQEATEILQEVILKESFYPPLAINLSSLLYQQERFDEAEKYLRMAEKIMPDDGGVQFNLALILSGQGRFTEAEEYVQRLEQDEDDPDILKRVGVLKGYLSGLNTKVLFDQRDAMMTYYEEERRKKIEEKPLSPEANLAGCLKKMPAEWLTGLCRSLQIKPASRREERERQCYKCLLDRERLHELLDENVDSSERNLLRYLLRNGGCARLSAVSRKFGKMEGDGFYWEDKLPASALGVLWALGLAAVGKTNLGKRREKIVVVPQELREPLSAYLGYW